MPRQPPPTGAAQGDLLIQHARVYPMTPDGGERPATAPLRGEALRRLPTVPDATVAIRRGVIRYVGPSSDVPRVFRTLPAWDARGRAVVPGFVDPHTHVPFAAWRADEYVRRLRGEKYAQQQGAEASKGDPMGEGGGTTPPAGAPLGGIPRSAHQVAQASDSELYAFAALRVREALETGTTTLEMKSGYGLCPEGEGRLLRCARALAQRFGLLPSVTGLFLHAVPPGTTEKAWVEIVLGEILPTACAAHCLDAVDAFVEPFAFSAEAAMRLVQAGQSLGLRTHLHLDQVTESGLIPWACAHHVTSVDHLDRISETGIRALAEADTMAVVLPAATFLGGPGEPLPVREMLARGVGLALGTDLNPGTAPVSSLPECMALAARMWGVDAEEALAMSTVNAACALGLQGEVGAVRVGARGDLVVLDGDSPDALVYRLGHPALAGVVHLGTWVGGDAPTADLGGADAWGGSRR